MVQTTNVFEVRALKGSPNWTVLSTWDNSEEAAEEARDVIASRKYLGVRVVHTKYDPLRNRYRETTILKHYKLHAKWLSLTGLDSDNRRPAPRRQVVEEGDDFEDDEFDEDEMSTDHRAKLVAIVLCAFVLANVALGLVVGADAMFSDGSASKRTASVGPTTIYDLPAVTMNLTTPKGSTAVRIALSLELDRNQDVAEVEAALSGILQSIFNNLEGTDAQTLHDERSMIRIRDRLQKAIETAAGGAQIHRVLFKDIHPL